MPIKIINTEKLVTEVYDTRQNMGKAAAKAASAAINAVLKEKDVANVIFAAAPSQNELLASLIKEDVDFTRVNAFHRDEYVGLSIDDAQSFARFLCDSIFSKVPFRTVNYIPASLGIDAACEIYAKLITDNPPDVVCMGIGENGHIAFNDPPVADFFDKKIIKPVELDEICRNQQVHDGCFPTLSDVPTHALTLTVPTLMSASHLICTVPAPTKAKAVFSMLYGEYGEVCPATALRRHKSAKMFLDRDSAALVL